MIEFLAWNGGSRLRLRPSALFAASQVILELFFGNTNAALAVAQDIVLE